MVVVVTVTFSDTGATALLREAARGGGGAARPSSPTRHSPWGPGGLLLKMAFVLAISVVVILADNIGLCST